MNSLQIAVLIVSLFFVAKQALAQDIIPQGSDFTGIILFAVLIIGLLISLAILVYWLLTLYRILTAKNPGKWKILWFLVVFFLSVIGLIIYLLVGKKKRISKSSEPTEAFKQHTEAPAQEQPKQTQESFSSSEKFVPKLDRLGKSDLLKEPPREPVSDIKEFKETFQEPPKQEVVSSVLSEGEQEQVNQLVKILEEEKQNYSSEQVKRVVTEKGYSAGVAQEVAKKLYG